MEEVKDLTQANPPQEEVVENQEQEQPQETAQPQVNWDDEGNVYKKRYADSQSQIQPLVRTLQQFADFDHTTKSWKPKVTQAPPTQEQVDEMDRLLDGYDPNFVKAMKSIITPLKTQVEEFKRYRKESDEQTDFTAKFTSSRSKAIEEFGGEFDYVKNGKFNPESPLYKMADSILCEKYAEFNPDGSFHRLTTPDGEYLATVEAYAILSRNAKKAPTNPNTGKLGAIAGKGSKAGGVKRKLSSDEYNKLSTSEKDTYDAQEMGA